jgi:hypothetical protein
VVKTPPSEGLPPARRPHTRVVRTATSAPARVDVVHGQEWNRGGRMPDHEDTDAELRRYRRAAEDAMQQLDWCIGYLHGIRKTQISAALSRNRSQIRTKLLDVPEQPLPSSQTNDA